MPLKTWPKSFVANIKELIADNKKKWKAMGAGWKKRPMKQILAIAYAKKRG